MLRTNTCGELNAKDINKKVKLAGWCQSRRDHGGLIFIDIRDRYGLTQIVFDPSTKDAFKIAENLKREDVILAEGKVVARKKGMENPKLKTGEIEVEVSKIEVFSKAKTPPIEIDDRVEAGEEMRLKYRYLDLRRPKMQKQIIFRHKVAQSIREYLNKESFLEIETPFLVKSTPEGARDYLVPSRVNPGNFYSLPQSPQLYKQILMVAGFDRYYQFARCLRDEDLREDRQPEHTQLDLEFSFCEVDDVLSLAENLMKHVFKQTLNVDLKTPFKRLTYEESMDKYGTDKPDLRFGLELVDVSSIVKNSDFKVFKDVIAKKGIVKCINAKKAKFSRKVIDELINLAQQHGASGLAWMKVEKGKLESNIVKFFDKKLQDELVKKMKAKEEDYLFFVADKPSVANDVLSRLRVELGKRLNLIKEGFTFCFVTDYPLFEWNEEENKWDPMHHIFTAPKKEHVKFLDSDPGKVYGDLYDMVLNGTELFSGSIRNSNPEVQEKVMEIIGMSKKEAEDKFGFLLEAYKYGGPIHAGFGLGIDRLVALMLGFSDIREVIAFPKNKAAQCPMDGSPSPASAEQLKELGISVVRKK